MMHDAHAARTLLTTLLGRPDSDNAPRLNSALTAADLARSIQTAIDTLDDMADGAGTFFQPSDLPAAAVTALNGPEGARDWLDRNARRIADRMAEAGNETIATLLAMEGLPTEDEDDEDYFIILNEQTAQAWSVTSGWTDLTGDDYDLFGAAEKLATELPEGGVWRRADGEEETA